MVLESINDTEVIDFMLQASGDLVVVVSLVRHARYDAGVGLQFAEEGKVNDEDLLIVEGLCDGKSPCALQKEALGVAVPLLPIEALNSRPPPPGVRRATWRCLGYFQPQRRDDCIFRNHVMCGWWTPRCKHNLLQSI